MHSIVYIGPFRNHIKNHIELKQAIGYKYDIEAHHLKCFDRFTLEKYPEATHLTKEIVLDWCGKKTYESQANQCSRACIIRQFGKYLDSSGVKTYITPKGYYRPAAHYVPYIYTVDELKRFFAATAHYRSNCQWPHGDLILPLIFRMIYMCGLRSSEARLLKVADVDLEHGILTINQSKKDNSRLVPMSDYLTELCRCYSVKIHPCPTSEDYYFPGRYNKPVARGTIYQNFRRFLWRAKISHGGKGYGPRVHDLRHTYAVHCLKKWVEQEKELTIYLPMLKTYMGHDSFEETSYYVRLTVDVFPDIILKLETQYSGIIPESTGEIDAAY